MQSATWAIALLGGAGFVISALVYGALVNRRCDLVVKPTKEERAEELAMRRELLHE
jgi:hypothetical protein